MGRWIHCSVAIGLQPNPQQKPIRSRIAHLFSRSVSNFLKIRLSTSLKSFIFILGLALSVGTCTCQDSILQSFTVSSIDNTVQLNWTIKSGNTCQGINILRSTDSLNFTEIGDIQGVCGSIDQAESYNFLDPSPPKNKRIYYRLELGFNGLSDIRSIDYFLIEDELLIFPNPANNQATIIVKNTFREQLKLTLYSFQGELILSRLTSNERFELNLSELNSGQYIVRIQNMSNLNMEGHIARLIVFRT